MGSHGGRWTLRGDRSKRCGSLPEGLALSWKAWTSWGLSQALQGSLGLHPAWPFLAWGPSLPGWEGIQRLPWASGASQRSSEGIWDRQGLGGTPGRWELALGLTLGCPLSGPVSSADPKAHHSQTTVRGVGRSPQELCWG